MHEVVALLPVYNDARYLAGWLQSVGRHVDAVVALDDGSTDESLEILASSPYITDLLRVAPDDKPEWNEPHNRELLVTAGKKLDAEWFVAFDADERPERRLWDEWGAVTAAANAAGALAIGQPLREVWGQPHQYRVDGVWGRKEKVAVFRNLGAQHQFDPSRWHGEWFPAQLIGTDRFHAVDINLYHLKMMRPADRHSRMQRYLKLDPDRQFQSMGYEYLTDEEGIELAEIHEDRAYEGMAAQRGSDATTA